MGESKMVEFPSALDLEFLSDSELMDKIAEVITVIEQKKTMQEDDQDEQDFLEELETEQIRRQQKPSTKGIGLESILEDDED
jgi:hypothetical protein